MDLRTPIALTPFLLSALALAAPAHDDDPKILDLQPPYQGTGISRVVEDGSPFLAGGAMPSFASNGVTLLGWLSLTDLSGGNTGNDCWGYVSPSGKEYAIIGLSGGTVFVEVNGGNPKIVRFKSGPQSLWRDIKTHGEYAYVVTEGGGGIQVFDLTNIDNGTVPLANTVGTGPTHNVAIDTGSGFLYRTGGGSGGGNAGLRIYDLNVDPINPPQVATWNTKYVHDAQIHTYTSGPNAGKQIAYCFAGFNGGFDQTGLTVLDVTDKSSIFILDEVSWSSAGYSHQGWLSDDLQYLYVNDELDEPPLSTRTIVIDVSNPSNVSVASTFSNGNPAIGHNLYTAGNLLFEANYRSGLRVFDTTNPTNPTEVAYFDTYPDSDSANFNGLWSCYPYLPSGIVLGSDMQRGLFLFWVGGSPLTFDLPSGAPTLVSAAGESVPVSISEATPGDIDPGTERFHYSTGGSWQSFQLTPLGSGNYQADIPPLPCGVQMTWYVSARTQDGIRWTYPEGGASAGFRSTLALGENPLFADDFETNQGWTTASSATSGQWQRGVPVDDSGWDYDPVSDSDGSGSCYLTQNANGNTDVDGGSVTLTSPPLDLSGGGFTVQWDYFLRLSDDDGTDRILVEASGNGTSGPWIEVAVHDTDGGLAWRSAQVTREELIGLGVPLTTNARFRFTANDGDPQSIVEAGIDAFQIDQLQCNGGFGTYCTPGTTTNGCQAVMTSVGQASSSIGSGFQLIANNVEGEKLGLIFYGMSGPLAAPWGASSSFRCVASPVQRTTPSNSGGTAGQCDGAIVIDWNDYIVNVNVGALGSPFSSGETIWAQAWFRDPPSPETTNLSNGIQFTVGF